MEFKLSEECDISILEKICKSPYISSNNARDYILYYKEMSKNGKVEVTYTKKLIDDNTSYGRYYSNKFCITRMTSPIRAQLFSDTQYDIDITNCAPTILLNICIDNNIPCKYLKRYIEDRDEFINDLNIKEEDILNYNKLNNKNVTKKDIGKSFFNAILNGGNNDITKKNYNLSDYIIKKRTGDAYNLREELKSIKQTICNNQDFRKQLDILKDHYNNKKDKSYHDGIGIALLLQSIETMYVYDAIQLCIDNGINVTSYIYDGFQIEKNDKINDLLKSLGKDVVEFIIKPFKTKFFDLKFENKLRTDEQIESDWNKYLNCLDDVKKEIKNKKLDYKSLKENFELTHAKIINKSIFIKKDNDTFITFTKDKLSVSYEHLMYQYVDKDDDGNEIVKSKSFISNWLKDPEIRQYVDMEVYPDNNKCPDGIFNLWTPFKMENIINYKHDQNAIELFNYHLFLMSGKDKEVYEYLQKYIAHMIQYPDKKSTCPILIGEQGCGKSTIVDFLSNMLGKTFVSTDPSRDVYGPFNSKMATSYLVNLNELSKKDTNDSIGKIKGLITDRTLSINAKGKDLIEIISYHHFIFTSNNDDPFKIEFGDRRFIIVKCSDDKKGDHQYFNELQKILNNNDSLKSIFEYYKNDIECSDFIDIPIPETEHQLILKESNRKVEEVWFESYTYELYQNGIIDNYTVSSTDLYNNFTSYLKKSGLSTYETSIIKFAKNISFSSIIKSLTDSKKGSHGSRNKIIKMIDAINFYKFKEDDDIKLDNCIV